MTYSKGLLIVAMTLLCAQALAQSGPPASARATIESISADGETLSVRTRAGEQASVHLKPTTRVVLVVPAALADVKPGSFVGVAALPGEGNELKAMGSKLTVAYKGGEQTIVVGPETPIVSFEPGDRSEFKAGAAIIARGPKEADGSIDGAFVLVGKDGLVPPM